jgi:hypothetical protein
MWLTGKMATGVYAATCDFGGICSPFGGSRALIWKPLLSMIDNQLGT